MLSKAARMVCPDKMAGYDLIRLKRSSDRTAFLATLTDTQIKSMREVLAGRIMDIPIKIGNLLSSQGELSTDIAALHRRREELSGLFSEILKGYKSKRD